MAGCKYFVSLICSVPSHLNISFSCLKLNERTAFFNYLIHRIFSQSRFTGQGNHLPACKFPLIWFCFCQMALFKLFQIISQTQNETIPRTKLFKLLLPAAVQIYTVFQEIGYYDQSRSRTACDR